MNRPKDFQVLSAGWIFVNTILVMGLHSLGVQAKAKSGHAPTAAPPSAAPGQLPGILQPRAIPPSQVAGKFIPETPDKPSGPVPVRLGGPVDLQQRDPLKEIAPGAFQGELVYVALVPRMVDGYPVAKPILVLRQLANQHSERIQTDAIESSAHIGAPEFSPNGKYVLLRAGQSGNRGDAYHIFILNLISHQVEFGPGLGISYFPVCWSPDSKALAFVRGGDVEGEQLRNGPVPTLYIYHLDTGHSVPVAENPFAIDFAFADQQTLLYTFLGDAHSAAVPEDASSSPTSAHGNTHGNTHGIHEHQPLHPAIYQALQGEGTGNPLILDGYHPVPSPNKRWIVFNGWSASRKDAPADQERPHSWPCLYLFDRLSGQRTLLVDHTFDDVRWTPDSKFLITMKTRYSAGNGIATLSKVDILTKTIVPAGIVTAHDHVRGVRQSVFPQFKMQGFSHDSEKLFLNVRETGPRIPALNASHILDSWQEVDLTTGVTRVICRFNQEAGYDWHETPSQ